MRKELTIRLLNRNCDHNMALQVVIHAEAFGKELVLNFLEVQTKAT